MMSKAVCLTVLLGSVLPCLADQADAKRTTTAYFNSKVYEKVAPICSGRLPEFGPRFQAAWPRWLDRNTADIDKGAQYLRADAAAKGTNFPITSAAVVNTAVSRLQSAGQAQFLAACNDVIRDVEQ